MKLFDRIRAFLREEEQDDTNEYEENRSEDADE